MNSSRLAVGLLVAVAAVSPARLARAADDEARLAQAVRGAQFPDKKREAVRKLAAKKSAAARKELLALLEDGDAWTSEAALFGLALVGDRESDEALVDYVEKNGFHVDEIVAALKERKSFPVELLAKRYATTEGFRARTSFVAIARALRTKEAESFLRDAVKATGEARDRDARAQAFEGLVEAWPDSARALALELVPSDEELRAQALTFLVAKGTAADLGSALGVIDKAEKADEALLVAAYGGVAKWADAKVQKEKYLAALRSKSDERARAAMAAFPLLDADVTKDLGRLVRHAAEQRTRIFAATRLSTAPAVPAGQKDAVVPALVAVLKETFEAREEAPLVVDLLTLGISHVADLLTRHWDKKAFGEAVDTVAAALERRTGVKLGKSYDEWFEWAVLHGATVDGHNAMQLVFAPDKEKRRRAQDGAAALLGFKNREDFVKKTAGLANEDGAVAVALAQRLVEKGFLVDED